MSESSNKVEKQVAESSCETSFRFLAANATETVTSEKESSSPEKDSSSAEKESSIQDDGDGSSEDMEVEGYSRLLSSKESTDSRDDEDPTCNVLHQEDPGIPPESIADSSLVIDTSHETTAEAPIDETKTPEVVKRTIEPNAEPPYTEEGTAAKRLKMSAPKLFKPSLRVPSHPSRLSNKAIDMTKSVDFRKCTLLMILCVVWAVAYISYCVFSGVDCYWTVPQKKPFQGVVYYCAELGVTAPIDEISLCIVFVTLACLYDRLNTLAKSRKVIHCRKIGGQSHTLPTCPSHL